jgi:hypothetical protein
VKTGARTVGCCSHIISIILYFGVLRHSDKVDTNDHLDDFFKVDDYYDVTESEDEYDDGKTQLTDFHHLHTNPIEPHSNVDVDNSLTIRANLFFHL